jgi:hypothetical protein
MQIPEPEMEIRPDSVTRFKLADNGHMQYYLKISGVIPKSNTLT